MTGAWRLARPEALALLLLAVPILWLHLRGARRARVVVPSLLLFEGGGGRGAPPLRAGTRLRDAGGLALELAALAALALAAATPVPSAGPARPAEAAVAIVIDASASTAGDGRDAAIRDRALAEIRAVPRDAPLTVLAAAGHVVVLAVPGDARADVEAAVRALRPALAGGAALSSAVGAARAAASGVVVVTDGSDAALPRLAALPGVTVVAVGGTRRNGGVVGVAVEPGTGALRARVRDADGHVEERRVEPAGPEGALVALPRAARDALDGDDIVPVPPWTEPRRPGVAVVTEDGAPDAFLRAALAAADAAGAIDGARSVTVRAGAPLPPGADVAVVVAGGGPPPRVPALVFLAGTAEGVPVALPGDAHHPVMVGVDVAELLVARARPLRQEPGDAILVEGPAGPLALAGTREGRRVVLVGFLPGESTLPLGAALPVLVRNAVAWLAADGARELRGVLAVGAEFEADVGADAPDGDATLVGPFAPGDAARAPRRAVPLRGGRVRFRVPVPPDASTALLLLEAGGRRRGAFGVALLDAEESDLTPRVAPAGPPPAPDAAPAHGSAATGAPATPDPSVAAALALAAVALLVAEAVRFRLRRDVDSRRLPQGVVPDSFRPAPRGP